MQGGVKEIRWSQRYADRPEFEEAIADESPTDRAKRDKEIAEAIRYGCTMKGMAGHLGVHHATANRALKKV